MKKVLIASALKDLLAEKNSYLDRADIRIYKAASNDEMLSLHRGKKADLIITQLDMSGIKSEELFTIIRKSRYLRKVSVIIVCKDNLANRELCKKCGANAVLTVPVDKALLNMKVRQFLSVAPREAYRAALAVGIEGKFKNRPQPFWTENISTSGMLIKSGEPLERNTGIFFSFFLPDGTHVSGYGEIIRLFQAEASPEEFQYGIKFTNIEPAVQKSIEKVVK
jgi:CheY-like chemotaxis protein